MKTIYLFFLMTIGFGLSVNDINATRNFYDNKLFYEQTKVKEPQDKKSQELISMWRDKFSRNPRILEAWRRLKQDDDKDLKMIYNEHLKWDVPFSPKVFQGIIESGWEDTVSYSGAQGHWQIMLRTATEECGLRVDSIVNGKREVDERKDKLKSTPASFCLQRKFYERTWRWSKDPSISVSDRWLWSLVSYNWGPGNTVEYFKKCGGDFSLFLVYLPSAKKYDQVRNYVAKIFAARRYLRDHLSNQGEIESPAQFAWKVYLKVENQMGAWEKDIQLRSIRGMFMQEEHSEKYLQEMFATIDRKRKTLKS